MANIRPAKFLTTKALKELKSHIYENGDLYLKGNFSDLLTQPGWRLEEGSIEVDYDSLSSLVFEQGGAEEDRKNAIVVYESIKGMTPALARQEKIWAALCHEECLEYTRKRWSIARKNGNFSSQKEKFEKHIRKHFFADTYTAVRDDNAVSRLWWTAHIAQQIMPDNWKTALEVIFFSADVRNNLIERPLITSRPKLAHAIIVILERDRTILSNEKLFRSFMKVINRNGSGILFEVWDDKEIRQWVEKIALSVLQMTDNHQSNTS